MDEQPQGRRPDDIIDLERYWDVVGGPGGHRAVRRRSAGTVARRYARLSEAGQKQVVDTAMWEVAKLGPTSAPPQAVLGTRLRLRAIDELRREGLATRQDRARIETVSLVRDDGTIVGEDRWRVEAVDEGVTIDVALVEVWVSAQARIVDHTAARLTSRIVRGHPDREASARRVGAIAEAVAVRCAGDAEARILWEHDARLATYRALRAVEPEQWRAYPADRLPTRPEVGELSSTPDATWKALHNRVLGAATDLVRDVLREEAEARGLPLPRPRPGGASPPPDRPETAP